MHVSSVADSKPLMLSLMSRGEWLRRLLREKVEIRVHPNKLIHVSWVVGKEKVRALLLLIQNAVVISNSDFAVRVVCPVRSMDETKEPEN